MVWWIQTRSCPCSLETLSLTQLVVFPMRAHRKICSRWQNNFFVDNRPPRISAHRHGSQQVIAGGSPKRIHQPQEIVGNPFWKKASCLTIQYFLLWHCLSDKNTKFRNVKGPTWLKNESKVNIYIWFIWNMFCVSSPNFFHFFLHWRCVISQPGQPG